MIAGILPMLSVIDWSGIHTALSVLSDHPPVHDPAVERGVATAEMHPFHISILRLPEV